MSAVIAIGLPGFAQWKVNDIVKQSMSEILSNDSDSAEAAVKRIKRFHWAVDANRIVREYEGETDATRRVRLGKAYKEITGEEIERRLMILKD